MHVKIREEETAETAKYYDKIFERLKGKMKTPPSMQYVPVRHGGEGAAQDILNYAGENVGDFPGRGLCSMHRLCLGMHHRLLQHASLVAIRIACCNA